MGLTVTRHRQELKQKLIDILSKQTVWIVNMTAVPTGHYNFGQRESKCIHFLRQLRKISYLLRLLKPTLNGCFPCAVIFAQEREIG